VTPEASTKAKETGQKWQKYNNQAQKQRCYPSDNQSKLSIFSPDK